MNDLFYLKECLKEAKKAFKKDEVPVGCVIVKDEQIIARAHNLREKRKSVLAHAEIEAIRKACKKLDTKFLDGCTIYITLEPCLMCLGAIMQSRISRVVFSAYEPKFGAVKSAGEVLNNYKSNHNLVVSCGELEDEVSSLMKEFFRQKRHKI